MEKHQKEFFYTNLGLKGAPNGKSGLNAQQLSAFTQAF